MKPKLTELQRKQRRLLALIELCIAPKSKATVKWIRKLTDEAIRLQMELAGVVPAPMGESATGITRKFRIDLDND